MAGSGNDVGWIFSIVLLLTLVGFFIPFVEETMEMDSSKIDVENYIPDDSRYALNDTAESGSLLSPFTNMKHIITGMFNAYIYTWEWMWLTPLGIMFGLIHITIRLVLIVLVYRLARSGGG